MTAIDNLKKMRGYLLLSFSIALISGLTACGGGAETESNFSSVDPAEPVSDWVLVWEDDFSGSSINTDKWTHEVDCNGGGNNEKQCYTDSADNSYVADGNLNIVALPAPTGSDKPYTSARLNTRYNGDFKYGRIEMRAKLPEGQGTWPAFWMMPTNEVYGGWPKSGEIDIMEAVNLKATDGDGVEASVTGTLHYGKDSPNDSQSGKQYDLPNGVNPADGFHTYAIEWQEGEIRWYVDGFLFQTQRASQVRYNSKDEPVGLVHRGWFTEYYDLVTGELETQYNNAPFDQEFYLLLNLAVGGDWPENVNDLGIDDAAFTEGQTFSIDYIKVYECSIDPTTGKGCETVRGGYDSLDDALVEGQAPIPSPPSTGIAQDLIIFNDANNPAWTIWDCCGGSTPTVETDDAEHGATAEFVIGAQPTVMGFTTRAGHGAIGGSPFDASPMISSGSLKFDMKVTSLPNDTSATWLLKVESSEGSTAVELPLTSSLEGVAPVQDLWQTYTFPLQVLADGGLDLSAIDIVMIFPAWGAGEGAVYRVDNVEISQDGAMSYPELVLFEDSENPLWQAWDCCAGSIPTFEMDDANHGMTTEFIIGAQPTVMGYTSREGHGVTGGVPFDASALLTEGVVQFDMKLVTAPNDVNAAWLFKVESGDGTTAVEIPLNTSSEGVDPVVGQWQTYTFSIQDLSDAGLDISAIDVVMIFPAWGAGEGAVYRVDNAKIYNPNASSGGFTGLTVFSDSAAEQWSIWDCCGGSTPTVETDDATHGSTAEFVIGGTPTVMGFLADDGVYYDASADLATGVVQFEMKVVSAPNDAGSVWKFKIESGDATTAVEIDLATGNGGTEPLVGAWQTYTFALQDLFDAGLELSAIDVIMVYPAWGTGDGAVYRVDNVIIGTPASAPPMQGLQLYEDSVASLWAIWDCCAGSTPTEETDDASHGTTAEFVIGAQPTVMGFTSREGHGVTGGTPFDAAAYLATGVVQFEMKVVSAPNDSGSVWKFKIESNDGNEAVELDLITGNDDLEPVTGEWATYTFTLQDLFDAGLDISAIDVVMIFPAWGTGDGAVYRIDNAIIGIP